jgi:feruloyl esterase
MHLLSVLPLLVITTHASSASFKSKCEAFVSDYQKHSPKNIAVNIAQYLPSNANITHVNDGYDARCVSVGSPPLPVPICRLSLNVTTSPSSMTVMEAWLPENWTGRFLSVGNGGFGGCVQYVDMAYSTSFGFASVGTNNGHNDILDKDFFNAPEVLRDFTWRALYTGVVVGKDLTKEFYGKPHTKSYYFGCSQGGRQGFKAVQDHPELFDGVIAGAPYINGNQQLAFWGYAYTVLGKEGSKTWLSIEQWSLYHNETLRQCDGQDGARDGILDNTRACKPDYTRLLCSGYATKDCLTRTQLDAANKLYAPWYLSGTLVHDGNQHGNELATITDLLFANGSIVPSWVTEWLAYVVYSDTSYLQRPVATYTEKELGDLARADPLNFNTFNGDISRFRDRGGKVLHW